MPRLSNAERLEIIKGTPYLITDDVLLRDFKWLVARVEVLEANLTGSTEVLDEAIASYTKSVNQNARLREALTFYADENNYEPKMNWWQQEDYELSEVIQDSGDIAKSVLEETK